MAKSPLVMVGLALLTALTLMISLLFVVTRLLTPETSNGCESTPTGSDYVVAASAKSGSLDQRQRANAAAVVAEGRRRNLPDRAIIIALAVARQESDFRNYANDGKGGDLIFSQAGIARSLSLPHEAVGTDHGSLGVFQQQWPWWGSMQDLMNPTKSAGKFYDALVQVSGWISMPVTVAAQRVQRSAFPGAYADDEQAARAILQGAQGSGTSSTAAVEITEDCLGGAAQGDIVFPLPASARYVDQRNWGHSASVWAHGHTGTDLSVACGTPVLAATSGTVLIRTDQSWAGRWLVQISTGEGKLTTWYAHMRSIRVAHGQTVKAGQQIGEVGAEGNATGCHLHFEVHPRGGSIYQDNINPSTWLKSNVGRSTQPVASTPGSGLTVATFNVLGHSHTTATGKHPQMASGPERTRGLVALLDKHAVDVAGLQEFQAIQKRAFEQLAGNRYAVYSPPGDTENSIVWRRDRLSMVKASTFTIPYFDGHPRRMPIVELRSRSGRITTFVNVHNPADTRRYPRQRHWREVAIDREVRVVRELAAGSSSGVVLTGDMNDRSGPFCALTQRAGMTASLGASGKSCRLPRGAGIDWIFARGVAVSGHEWDRTSAVRSASDHPLALAKLP